MSDTRLQVLFKWHKAIGQLQTHLWNNIINWLCTLTWNVLSLKDYHLFITSPWLLHSLSVMNTEGKEINLPCQVSHRSNMAHELTYEWREESHKYSKSFYRLHLHHYQTSRYRGPCSMGKNITSNANLISCCIHMHSEHTDGQGSTTVQRTLNFYCMLTSLR